MAMKNCNAYHMTCEERNVINAAKAWKRIRESKATGRAEYESAIARLDRAVAVVLKAEERERKERRTKRKASPAKERHGLRLLQGGGQG